MLDITREASVTFGGQGKQSSCYPLLCDGAVQAYVEYYATKTVVELLNADKSSHFRRMDVLLENTVP